MCGLYCRRVVFTTDVNVRGHPPPQDLRGHPPPQDLHGHPYLTKVLVLFASHVLACILFRLELGSLAVLCLHGSLCLFVACPLFEGFHFFSYRPIERSGSLIAGCALRTTILPAHTCTRDAYIYWHQGLSGPRGLGPKHNENLLFLKN